MEFVKIDHYSVFFCKKYSSTRGVCICSQENHNFMEKQSILKLSSEGVLEIVIYIQSFCRTDRNLVQMNKVCLLISCLEIANRTNEENTLPMCAKHDFLHNRKT